MSLPLTSFLRLIFIQCGLTVLLIFSLQTADAAEAVVSISDQINSYLYEGDSINLVKELDLRNSLKDGMKVLTIKVKAQAISNNAKLGLVVNEEETVNAELSERLEELVFNVKDVDSIENIKIISEGAFIRVAKADLFSDQPQDDDVSTKAQASSSKYRSFLQRIFW